MIKRPIMWGLIGTAIGAVGWLVFVIFSVFTLGKFRLLANVFGYLAVFSLPVAGIVKVIQRFIRKIE